MFAFTFVYLQVKCLSNRIYVVFSLFFFFHQELQTTWRNHISHATNSIWFERCNTLHVCLYNDFGKCIDFASQYRRQSSASIFFFFYFSKAISSFYSVQFTSWPCSSKYLCRATLAALSLTDSMHSPEVYISPIGFISCQSSRVRCDYSCCEHCTRLLLRAANYFHSICRHYFG